MKKQTKIYVLLFILIFIATLRNFMVIGTHVTKIPLTILIITSFILLAILLKNKKLSKKMNNSISFYFWSVLITIFISIFTLIKYFLNPPSPGYISQIYQDVFFVLGTTISIIMLIFGTILDYFIKNKK